jgi:hypothetical protein
MLLLHKTLIGVQCVARRVVSCGPRPHLYVLYIHIDLKFGRWFTQLDTGLPFIVVLTYAPAKQPMTVVDFCQKWLDIHALNLNCRVLSKIMKWFAQEAFLSVSSFTRVSAPPPPRTPFSSTEYVVRRSSYQISNSVLEYVFIERSEYFRMREKFICHMYICQVDCTNSLPSGMVRVPSNGNLGDVTGRSYLKTDAAPCSETL